MSAETKAALENAIGAHLADEGEGHMLTGYALIAVGVNTTNLDHKSSNYFTEYADGQMYHASLGLALQLLDETRTWSEYDGDDDER